MSIYAPSNDTVSAPLLGLEGGQVETIPVELVGDSAATRRVRLQIDRIGPHFRTVLVRGEIGTGKELVARALHERNRGGGGGFSTCYGAALGESVDDGSAHGPGSPWQPIIEGAHGTIFVDGVDDMTLRSQSRLLELVDGWTRSRVQTRMIAATGQDLKKLLGAGRFRADLYHRLAMIEIAIEPLRRRRDDISALTAHFLGRFAQLYGKEIVSVDDVAMDRLRSHDWPGNVRELENAIRNAVLRCEGKVLEAEHLGQMPEMKKSASKAGECATNRIESLQEVVDRHVVQVLELCGGNKVRAAELLGISRSTLYRMLDGFVVTNGRVA